MVQKSAAGDDRLARLGLQRPAGWPGHCPASGSRPAFLDAREVLRAAEEEDRQVIFTFLFYGGEAAEWQMEPILARAPGAEGARRALEDMLAMMKGLQHGWEMTPSTW
ncbi:MAG TPA: hypothetical protein VMK13_02730 [Streptosporangiaceae bacterium]|nr:hypothetical protein [Streptosporangiaceae bacterium]